MRRSLPIRLLLVLALLFAQIGGAAHGIAHALEERAQDQALPHDKLCDLCATYAQLGGALGGSPPALLPPAGRCDACAQPVAVFSSHPFLAAPARGPPSPLHMLS